MKTIYYIALIGVASAINMKSKSSGIYDGFKFDVKVT